MKLSKILLLSLSVSFLASPVFGFNLQNTLKSQSNQAMKECEPDIKKLCNGVAAKDVVGCLRSQPQKLSASCKSRVLASSKPAIK